MASAFGGGGSQTAFGARAGATVLTKATTVLGVLFMLGAIALGVIGKRGPGSLMRGLNAGSGSDAACRRRLRLRLRVRLRLRRRFRLRRRSRRRRRRRRSRRSRGSAVSASDRPDTHPRESGGTGRRTSLRGWRSQDRGGSSPPFRTSLRS